MYFVVGITGVDVVINDNLDAQYNFTILSLQEMESNISDATTFIGNKIICFKAEYAWVNERAIDCLF